MEYNVVLFNLRREAGVSYGELSKRTGIDRANISAFEKGNKKLTFEMFSTLINALNVNLKVSIVYPNSYISKEDLPINSNGLVDVPVNKVFVYNELRLIMFPMTPFHRRFLAELGYERESKRGSMILFVESNKSSYKRDIGQLVSGKSYIELDNSIELFMPSDNRTIYLHSSEFDILLKKYDIAQQIQNQEDFEYYQNILTKLNKPNDRDFKFMSKSISDNFFQKYNIPLDLAPDFRINGSFIDRLLQEVTSKDKEIEYVPWINYLEEYEY